MHEQGIRKEHFFTIPTYFYSGVTSRSHFRKLLKRERDPELGLQCLIKEGGKGKARSYASLTLKEKHNFFDKNNFYPDIPQAFSSYFPKYLRRRVRPVLRDSKGGGGERYCLTDVFRIPYRE